MSTDVSDQPAYATRRIGRVNWVGLYTLYVKEVQRFMKVVMQTVFAPAVTTLLFLTIFIVALGDRGRGLEGIPFEQFLVPGLIMMSIIQNSFANTSSSLLISKVQGNIVDVLMPPLSATELTFAFAAGGLTRGLMVAVSVIIPVMFFIPVEVAHPWIALYYAASVSLLLSLIGILGGIWAEKFDHLATVTNFVIMPLSFLSGTFYSISRLPEIWQDVSQYNPFFYAIDGFRYAFIGQADGSVTIGMVLLMMMNLAFIFICYRVFKTGYRLKT